MCRIYTSKGALCCSIGEHALSYVKNAVLKSRIMDLKEKRYDLEKMIV